MSKIWIKIAIVLALLFTIYIGKANAVNAPAPKLEELSIPELITLFSTQYDVSYTEMYKTIECETRFRNIQSQIFTDGKQEESYGIVQIHLPSNPTISKQQALDPIYSVEFMAKQFSKGKQRNWTCARKLGYAK